MIQYNITFFNFFDFLEQKTPPAHKSSGITLKTLLSSLAVSVIFATSQILFFSYLRPRILQIYQPRSHYAPEKHRVELLPSSFFGWVLPTISYNLSNYIDISGLDAYFFLRFLRVLAMVSAILCVINVPILLPVNYSGNDGSVNVNGLDKLSWSNIGPKNCYLFNFHTVLALMSIIIFHLIIFYELNLYVRIRRAYLLRSKQVKSVIMVDNIPDNFKQIYVGNSLYTNPIIQSLNKLPGGIKNVWFTYEFSQLKQYREKNKKLLRAIEFYETKILVDKWRSCQKNQALLKLNALCEEDKEASVEEGVTPSDSQGVTNNNEPLVQENDRPQTYAPVVLFNSWKMKVPFVSPKVDLVEELIAEYHINNTNLVSLKQCILQNKIPCYHKMFLQFNNKIASYIAKQILISTKCCDIKIIEVNPQDIIWNNINLNNFWMKRLRYLVSNILKIFLIVFWAIPSVLIGLFSQLPFFTTVFPFLAWIDTSPNFVKSLISGVFPALSLILITEIIPVLFRWLSVLKGKLTGAEVERDIQSWCFCFFFVHVFLVVAVSSTITAFLESLINNPASIPTMLAKDLPKSSNFFFSFILLRGLTYCGSNLLRSYMLFKRTVFYPAIKRRTPREKFENIIKLENVKWGSIYPIYSTLGSICIIFSIIAPLITAFSTISFSLILLSFKYSLKFCYHYNNKSETFGKFYPDALMQLYGGIYCLEISLAGLFFLVRNQNDEAVFMSHGFGMIIVFLISLSTHMYLSNSCKASLKFLPLEDLENEETTSQNNISPTDNFMQQTECNINQIDNESDFLHPSFKHNALDNFVWLPKDKYGINEQEIQYLKSRGIDATSDNCILNDRGEVLIRGYPQLEE